MHHSCFTVHTLSSCLGYTLGPNLVTWLAMQNPSHANSMAEILPCKIWQFGPEGFPPPLVWVMHVPLLPYVQCDN